MAYIFGGDINSLAGQKNTYDQMNVNLALQDRALRQKAQDEYQQQMITAQRQAEEDARQNAAQRFQFDLGQQDRADRLAGQAYDRGMRMFDFTTGRADRAAQDAESRRRFDIQTGLETQRLNAAKGQGDYSELVNAVQSGGVKTPEEIDSLFGHLSDGQRDRAKTYLAAAQQGKLEDYQAVDAAARAATGMVRPKPVAAVPGAHFWNRDIPAVPAKVLNEDEAMAALAGVKALNKFLPQLTWDEASQSFQPVMRKPGFNFTVPTAATGTNAPQFALPPSPVTQTVTNPPAAGEPVAFPGYKMGAVYKGGLQYLGGDPNVETSWRQVSQ